MAPRILIIDADQSAAQVTGALVERIAPAATVAYAATPGGGWLAAQCIVPDVLIIDPDPLCPASTLLIQLCKAAWPQIRIVVLTLTRTSMAHVQVDGYINKAASTPTLVETLRTALHDAALDPCAGPNVQAERTASLGLKRAPVGAS